MSKVEMYVTPIGVVKFPKTIINDKEYPFLFVPKDIPEDAVTSWKFSLAFDPEAGKAVIAKLDELAKPIKGANFAPYKKDKAKNDDGDIEETGLVAVNFTSGYPIAIVDAAKDPCDIKVGWGSKVRVMFSVKPVNNKGKVGLGRYCKAIQVIDLKESGTDLSGFGKEEGFSSNSKSPWDTEEENAG